MLGRRRAIHHKGPSTARFCDTEGGGGRTALEPGEEVMWRHPERGLGEASTFLWKRARGSKERCSALVLNCQLTCSEKCELSHPGIMG